VVNVDIVQIRDRGVALFREVIVGSILRIAAATAAGTGILGTASGACWYFRWIVKDAGLLWEWIAGPLVFVLSSLVGLAAGFAFGLASALALQMERLRAAIVEVLEPLVRGAADRLVPDSGGLTVAEFEARWHGLVRRTVESSGSGLSGSVYRAAVTYAGDRIAGDFLSELRATGESRITGAVAEKYLLDRISRFGAGVIVDRFRTIQNALALGAGGLAAGLIAAAAF